MLVNLEHMRILAAAEMAMRQGDRAAAVGLVDRYTAEAARAFEGADPEQLATLVAPAAVAYERFGEWELAALKAYDVCALAEKFCPNTRATAGDYHQLSRVLAALKDYAGAIAALENSVRHLQGAGEWEQYREGYEAQLSRLRALRAASP